MRLKSPRFHSPAKARTCKLILNPASFRLWRPLALLAALRKALPVLSSFPHLPLFDLPHRLCIAHGVADCAVHRPLGDPEAARVSDRPVRPRRRPAVAPEEDRHAHHGRHSHRDCHCAADGALVGSIEPIHLDCCLLYAGVRGHRICGRLHQGCEAAQPGSHRARQAAVAGTGWRGCRHRAGYPGSTADVLNAADGAVRESVAARSALALVAGPLSRS